LVEIVGSTTELYVFRPVITASAERFNVVILEPPGFCATAAVLVLESAPTSITLVDRPLDRRRDVAGRSRRIGLFDAFSRILRLPIALGFELL
jgi:hypothetical protein